AARRRAVDGARYLVAEQGVMLALLRPQHLFDRGLEGLHPGIDGRVLVEGTNTVVLKEGRGRPDADERRYPRIATPAGRHLIGHRLTGKRIVDGDLADRWQVLIGLRREIVPDIAGDGIGRERAAGIGPQQGHGHAEIRREIVVIEEVRRLDDRAHLALVLFGAGPGPVALPAIEISRPGTAIWIEAGCRCRCLAGMAAGAGFREHDFAAVEG